ncbi:MAG TPA: hypothetical protein VGJ78_22325 [Vicinamibacterales bacterium]|jgi:hypothetical protein
MTEGVDLDRDEERAVAAFMSRVANLGIPDPGSRIPDPAQLWCKARLLRQWEAERRAYRPLDIMQPIEIAGGLIAAGLLLYWSIPYL